jgi:hypothetical protein
MDEFAMYYSWHCANRLTEIYAVESTLSTGRLATGIDRLALTILWHGM